MIPYVATFCNLNIAAVRKEVAAVGVIHEETNLVDLDHRHSLYHMAKVELDEQEVVLGEVVVDE